MNVFVYKSRKCVLIPSSSKKIIHVSTCEEGKENERIDAFDLADVVGIELVENFASIHVYAYPRQKTGKCTSEFGHRKEKTFRFDLVSRSDTNLSNARTCVKALRELAAFSHLGSDGDTDPPRRKRFLLILNPFSGKGTSMKDYESTINPMLKKAAIDHDLFLTERSGHAKERMKRRTSNEVVEQDASCYDAIITVGGDGSLWEVLQGISERPDRDEIWNKMKFGVVAGGTCNGLAKSLLHASGENYSLLESVFLICKGKTTSIDLSTYFTRNHSYKSFLSFSWAFIADCDIESEKLRFLGTLRNDVYAVWRWINLRTYSAKLSYLPFDETTKSCQVDSLPPLSEPVPSHWETIEEEFLLFWVSHVSHTSYDLHQSPYSTLNDGLFHILFIRKSCPRLAFLKILLQFEAGSHAEDPNCEWVKCVAYRLEPITSGSYNDLDGEVVESGPIQACVLPGAMQVYGSEASREPRND